MHICTIFKGTRVEKSTFFLFLEVISDMQTVTLRTG